MNTPQQETGAEKRSYYDPGTVRERLLYGALTLATYAIPMAIPGMTLKMWAAGFFGLCVILPALYFIYGIFRPLFHHRADHTR
ncbi:MAG: hypothetical protein OEZ16_09045 [Chromatiales bacterium]|nr:hypothetical protein [Chromatiales bacterium]